MQLNIIYITYWLGVTYRRPQLSYFCFIFPAWALRIAVPRDSHIYNHLHFYFPIHWALRIAVPRDFPFPYLFFFPTWVLRIAIPKGFFISISTWALRIAVPRGFSCPSPLKEPYKNTNTSQPQPQFNLNKPHIRLRNEFYNQSQTPTQTQA